VLYGQKSIEAVAAEGERKKVAGTGTNQIKSSLAE
jgi:hypothetical protein